MNMSLADLIAKAKAADAHVYQFGNQYLDWFINAPFYQTWWIWFTLGFLFVTWVWER